MRMIFADDHPLFLDAVRGHMQRVFPEVEINFCESFEKVLEALDKDKNVDLVVLDFSMPGRSGLESIKVFRTNFPDIALAVTSGVADARDVKAVLDLGVRGFVPKSMSGSGYAGALRIIAEGGTYVPVDTIAEITAVAARGQGIHGLTPREVEVLKELGSGSSNKEIARKLDLSLVTVKAHTRNIFKKIGVQNRSQAAISALKLKI